MVAVPEVKFVNAANSDMLIRGVLSCTTVFVSYDNDVIFKDDE